jgi:hypothetical protein
VIMNVMVNLVANFLSQSLFIIVNGFILPSLPFTRKETWSFRKTSRIHGVDDLESRFVPEENVMTVPDGAPQEFTYTRDTFYIRSCYHAYYDKIMDRLFGKSYHYYFISVTGTPGIGKSMFYLYFLKRYLLENPGKSVVTASFDKDRVLQDCRLFRPNGIVEEIINALGNPCIPRKGGVTWPKDIDCDLFLYDGPPTDSPIDVKMVAFTSPNFSWLDSMRKDSQHCKLFMPTWDISELLAANEELELNIDTNEINNRFALFGGSARYCLSVDDEFLSAGKLDIESALKKIDGFDQLRDCFFGNADLNTVVHRLMYYCPENNPVFAKLSPASKLIDQMLAERLNQNLNDNRKLLMKWLDGSDKGSSFAGFLFDKFAHERLLDGGQFEMRSLSNSSRSMIDINQTIGQYSRFKPNFLLDDIFKYVYQIPEVPNYPSIDSFMISENAVLMFQITMRESHPVKLSSLVTLLDSLGQLDDDQENPLLAQLIFVVPKGMGENYRKQDIQFLEALVATNLETVRCKEIPGIGSKKNARLKDLGIENCKQLIDAHYRGEEEVQFVSMAIENLIRSRVNASKVEALQRIPQFVIEIDYYPESKSV